MAKKRKSVATSLDEVDRSMYSTFRSTANSLTQLYTQAMNQQKLSFQAGERHGLEKLYHWILRQQEGGSRVTTIDVISYLQNELDCSGEEASMPPRAPAQHQHLQPEQFGNNSGFLVTSGSSGSSGMLPSAQTFQSEPCDSQPRNYAFSNVLSSFQNYHVSPGSYFQNNVQPTANGYRGEANFLHHQSRDPIPGNSNDSSTNMQADYSSSLNWPFHARLS